MKNYIDEITTIKQFKQQHSCLVEQVDKALTTCKFHHSSCEENFVVIEVEGYHCIACIVTDVPPFELGEVIVPFDDKRIYPIQGLTTQYAFKR